MPKPANPKCLKCNGSGKIRWESMNKDGSVRDAGFDPCDCTKTKEEEQAERQYNRDHERIC